MVTFEMLEIVTTKSMSSHIRRFFTAVTNVTAVKSQKACSLAFG